MITNCRLTDSETATDTKMTYDSVVHIFVSEKTVTAYIARAVSNSFDHHTIYCDIKIQTSIHLESGEYECISKKCRLIFVSSGIF